MADDSRGYQRFFAELKRRRVFRVMAIYGAAAFAVIEAADVILPRMALPDWVVTLVVWMALLGLPVAVVLAWVFDITPEGVRRTAQATPGELTEILAAPASKHWPAGVLALLGMTAMLGGAWYVGRQSAPSLEADSPYGPASQSIAVLPFLDLSETGDQQFFSDGISEELLNLLARIPELRVAARTSSFSFRDQDVDISEIAQRLNVAHILEGSVRRAGNQVRITAQLIKGADGYHMWSETWDRTLEDIFAIQDEIAAAVVRQLRVTLLHSAPSAQVTGPEAYALYLQARQLSRQGTAEGFEQSIALYRQAIEIDAAYAAAWDGLASNYYNQAGYGLRPYDEGFRLSREAANRALSIDPEYAEAHARLGWIAMTYDSDLTTAARHLARALELEPRNPEIITNAAILAQGLGRPNESVAFLEHAVSRDPINVRLHHNLGLTYLWTKQFDEAIASFRAALNLSPGRIGEHSFIGIALTMKGDTDAAVEAMQQEPYEVFRLIGLAVAYHGLGHAAESDTALSELIEKYEQDWAYNIAYVLAFRGEADRAFEWLRRAVQYGDPGLAEIPVQILFDNIRSDPRWQPFLESIGKSPEQLAAIQFEVDLPQ